METLSDVYHQLCTDCVDERFTLTISDDKTLLTVKIGEERVLTADDDMIAVVTKKSLLGIPYDSHDHTHYTDFDDLYQRLLTYLSADAT